MATRLPRRVAGCGDCQRLHANAMNRRGDLADAKRKLVRRQSFSVEAAATYAEQIPDLKTRVREGEANYLAHRDGAHPDVAEVPTPTDQPQDQPPTAAPALRLLVELFADATWMDDAICSQTDPEAFYPDRGGSSRPAKAMCTRCDVTDKCLQYALDNHEPHGVWGGKSERERRKILRARENGAAA